MYSYAVGTVLTRPKGPLTHVGVVTEAGAVFHNTPERGEHESSLEEFAAGGPITVRSRVTDLPAFLHRLRQRRFNLRPYDAFSNNCEHTVTALIGEEPSSPQLQGWGILAGMAVAVAVLAR